MITKTILTLGIMAGFVIGISFSSVYAGVLVDTDDIADDAITSEKIGKKQVKTSDIKPNAIKSKKIKDGTIRAVDLAPGVVGATGAEGPVGAIGATGAIGPDRKYQAADTVGDAVIEVTADGDANVKVTIADADPTTPTFISILRDDGGGPESVLDYITDGDSKPVQVDFACEAGQTCTMIIEDSDGATQSTTKVESVADDLTAIVVLA